MYPYDFSYGFKTSDAEQELRDVAENGDIGEVARSRLIESGVSVNPASEVSVIIISCCTRSTYRARALQHDVATPLRPAQYT